MQFATLLNEGIAHCQKLGGDLWTDFNEHDPGLTILEQLCYVITEASYCADFSVEDLLAQDKSIGSKSARDTLFTGDAILTSGPVTIDDYRKLVYGRVSNLNSVWFECEESARFGPLHHVTIETYGAEDADLATAGTKNSRSVVREDVCKVLSAHRNLGEDFASIELLKPFNLKINAVIDVDPEAVPSTVLADVIWSLQFMLVPQTKVYSVEDRLNQDDSYDEIFDGPLTDIGIIEDCDLNEIERSISIESIARTIAGVQGVVDVRISSIETSSLETAPKKYCTGPIVIPAECIPRLDPPILKPFIRDAKYPISVTRNGRIYLLDSSLVHHHIQNRFAYLKNMEQVTTGQMLNEPYRRVRYGTYRQLERYYSVQHQFPRTYGMGSDGPALQGMDVDARGKRMTQARQLKAYLLLFDQVLSDSFGQIGNMWQLFALDQKVDASYFGQPLPAAHPNNDEPAHLRDWDLLRDVAIELPESASASVHHYVAYLTEGAPAPYTILRSDQVATLERARTLRDDILRYGGEEHNYQVHLKHGNQFQIELHGASPTAHGLIAYSAELVEGSGAAHAEVQRLVLLVKEMLRDPSVRHTQLRIEAQGKATVQLLDKAGLALLTAANLTPERQAGTEKLLSEYGINPVNYTVRKLRDEHYELYLFGTGGHVLAGNRLYRSHGEALQAARDAAEIVAAMCCEPQELARHLRLLAEPQLESGADFSRHREALAAIGRKHDNAAERRNRFLNHLLARFGECFDDIELARCDPRLHSENEVFHQDLIRWKIAFLRHCTGLGRNRNLAFDYRKKHPSGLGSRSGLELRLFCLLGLLGASGWEAAGVKPLVKVPPFLFWRAGASPELHEREAAKNEFFTFELNESGVFQMLLQQGVVRANFTLKPLRQEHPSNAHPHRQEHGRDHDGGVEVLFAWPGGKKRVVYEAASKAVADREIDRLIEYLGTYLDRHDIYAGEEMLLIEHVLLRPTVPLRHGVEEGAVSAERVEKSARAPQDANTALHSNFYAFRLSLFFPDWPLRFQNPHFRDFAVRTVAQNCPAHLAAQCYWIDARAMRRLNRLHSNWMALKQRVEGEPDAGAHADTVMRKDSTAMLNWVAKRLRDFIKNLDAGRD